MPGDRIGFLQVADAPLLDMNLLEWSRHHRCFPGQGTLDVTGVVAATLAAGYRGPLSLEVFSDVVRETDPHVTARDAMRSLVFLEDDVASVVPDLERGVVTQAAPRAARTDAAFLEIASPPGNSEVAEILGGLGFGIAGEHRSKPVTWWRNGDAHVVVNEQTSPARTPHASALGRHRTTGRDRRSTSLRPPVAGGRHHSGAGEAMLPGITSPSGLHVFVSDTPGHPDHWQGDFEPTGEHGTRSRRAASTTWSSRSPRCSSTRRSPSSAPSSGSSRGRPRSSWSRTAGCAASRCGRRRATCASC